MRPDPLDRLLCVKSLYIHTRASQTSSHKLCLKVRSKRISRHIALANNTHPQIKPLISISHKKYMYIVYLCEYCYNNLKRNPARFSRCPSNLRPRFGSPLTKLSLIGGRHRHPARAQTLQGGFNPTSHVTSRILIWLPPPMKSKVESVLD